MFPGSNGEVFRECKQMASCQGAQTGLSLIWWRCLLLWWWYPLNCQTAQIGSVLNDGDNHHVCCMLIGVHTGLTEFNLMILKTTKKLKRCSHKIRLNQVKWCQLSCHGAQRSLTDSEGCSSYGHWIWKWWMWISMWMDGVNMFSALYIDSVNSL